MPEKESVRLNKRVITFLICVLIATFFWLMMSFSKEYTMSFRFPVKYINFPTDNVIANHLPENIEIEIKSNGFNILGYKFKQAKEVVSVDIKDAKPLSEKNHFYLLTNARIDKFTAQFSNAVKIQKIYPDTIFLNFNKKITKSVPVKPRLNISFLPQYQLTDSVKLNPAFVSISGAADVIDKIKFVETEPMDLKNISNVVSVKLTILQTQQLKLVDVSQSTVEATVDVKKFTEGNILLPIYAENLPMGYNLKTFPDKVLVKFNIAFDDYEKINETMFKAIVDYNKIELGNSHLKVQLVKFPNTIHSVKINPEKVEFIIRK